MTAPAEYSFLLLLLSKTTVKKKNLLFHLVNHKYNPTICLICAEIRSPSMPAQPTYHSSLSHVFLTYEVSLSSTSQDTSRFDCPAHPVHPTGHTQLSQLILFIWTAAQPVVIQIGAGSLFFSVRDEYLASPAHVALEISNDCRCKRFLHLSLLFQWFPAFLITFSCFPFFPNKSSRLLSLVSIIYVVIDRRFYTNVVLNNFVCNVSKEIPS